MHKCEIELDIGDIEVANEVYHKHIVVRGFDESSIRYEDDYYDEVECCYASGVPRAKIIIKQSFIFWIQKMWFAVIFPLRLAIIIMRISKRKNQQKT